MVQTEAIKPNRAIEIQTDLTSIDLEKMLNEDVQEKEPFGDKVMA